MRIESERQKYVDDVFGLDDEDLKEVREEMHRHNTESISISSSEARIMQFLIKVGQVRKVVEIGTLFGYSAIAMAKALPRDGVLWTLEKNPTNFEIASRFFNRMGLNIRAMCGDANLLLGTLQPEGPFDLIFIDADKAAYPQYLNWAESHVRPGGFIVGDNTFAFGEVYGEEASARGTAMREFNQRLADSRVYNSVLLPTHEGLTIAQRKSQ